MSIGPEGQQTRVVNLPEFTESSTIALVNLDTLSCETYKFSSDDQNMNGQAAQSSIERSANGKVEEAEDEDLIPDEEFDGEL